MQRLNPKRRKQKQRCIAGFLSLLLCLTVFLEIFPCQARAAEPQVDSPSVILMEANSGQVIYEKNADEKLHPASITKIMTLILIFDALSEGKITLDEMVTVSENAAKMGGSQVFLEPGETQTVNTMIKCISVASANDASVAMAEHIWGNEATFVEKMNERAAGLGMTNTHFVNCCGLDEEAHLTTSKDVALMSRELIIKYPQIHDYSTIWMDTITHVTRRGESEFGLTNTNKLIKQYEWATGLKTGSTSLAKCCLSATAKKNNIELIAVVMAAPNSKSRFSDAITLLNYGYGICSVYRDEERQKLEPMAVGGGVEESVALEYEKDFTYMFLENYEAALIEKEVILAEKLEAPAAKGTVAGKVVYKYNGQEIGSVNIVTAGEVKAGSLWDSFGKIFRSWAI